MKPRCERCGEKEYDIAIPKKEGEELLCKKCFNDFILTGKTSTDIEEQITE